MSSDKAPFSWEDPFLLSEQLNEEERLVESSARDFAQDKLICLLYTSDAADE